MKKEYLIFSLVSVGLLLLFTVGFFSLKKQIAQVSSQIGKAVPTVSTNLKIEDSIESKISKVENDIQALRMYVYKQAGDKAPKEREIAYRSGYDDFSVKCKNMDNVSAEDLFKKTYYKSLSEILEKTEVLLPPTEGLLVPTTTTLAFPWVMSTTPVLGICEDDDRIYVIGVFNLDMMDDFYIIGEFDPSKNTFNVVSTKDVFFFLKEVEKNGDILNFLPDTDVCAGEGDFFVRCSDSITPSATPYHEQVKPGFQYNISSKKFTILDSKIIQR